MEKIKEIMNNKKIIILIISILLMGVLVIVVLTTNNNSQKQELTKKMEEMGKEFYENFYYKQVGSTDEERKEFLKKFETIGIKVNLDNLSRYNSQDTEKILKDFVNKKTNKECDKINTQVIIYPEEPYNQNSYKLTVNLECDFNEE